MLNGSVISAQDQLQADPQGVLESRMTVQGQLLLEAEECSVDWS